MYHPTSEDIANLRQHSEETNYVSDCQTIERFDMLRGRFENIHDEHIKTDLFLIVFEVYEISEKIRVKIYELWNHCDLIYGKKAKFIDLSKEHQELVLSLPF